MAAVEDKKKSARKRAAAATGRGSQILTAGLGATGTAPTEKKKLKTLGA
jgi:hypothetical protein